jgi:Holliday junction resolvase RusA-like endonuclease
LITLYGRPATKKNNGRIVTIGNFPKLLPSKAFVAYEKSCLEQLQNCQEQYEGAVWVKCEYWLPDKKWFPDLVNLLSATHDILEKAGVIDNDRNIILVDGSKIMGFDKTNPRAEVTITSLNVS